MNHKYSVLVSIFLVVALIGTISQTASAMGTHMDQPGSRSPPQQERMNDGSIWIHTDVISIMANSEVPSFRFWYTADENGTHAMFTSTYTRIIEFQDQNNDSAYQRDEELYSAPLSAYDWTVTTGSVVVSGQTTEVWLKYTKSGVRTTPMQNAPMMGFQGNSSVDQFKDVTMQIWAHLYLNNYTGQVTDTNGAKANYTVLGDVELKMDIEIGNFPFSTPTSSVALETLQHETDSMGNQTPQLNMHRIETRERFRNVTLNSAMNWTTTSGNETRFETRNGTSTQNIDFVDSTTGVAQGFFSWVDQAVITWPGGTTQAVNVTASYAPTGHGLALYLAYPNFDGGSILHDPSIGLYSAGAPTVSQSTDPILIIGIGIIAVVAVLLVLVRRK